ncbi:MAG: helicase C-terminal domain-containing protein [Peptostreptococcaceae bacterium]
MKYDIEKLSEEYANVLDNIIFLDIETSGLNPLNCEIIEIGAIKVKDKKIETFNTLIRPNKEIPLEIFSLCSGLNKEDFNNAPRLREIKRDLVNFLEGKVVVCHNASFEKSFFDCYLPEIKNKIIDSMELAAILEPYHKEYNLDYLLKKLISDEEEEEHRALSDSIDTMRVVSNLIYRLKEKEKSTLEPLVFKINSYLSKYNLPKWDWSDILDNANCDGLKINYGKSNEDKNMNTEIKEKEIIKKIYQNNKCYEELLKDKDVWESKEGFIYEFRPGQHELTKTIRETINGNSGSAKIACIEAPTGIGKSVGYLLPAILEAKLNKKRIIISTDTKELQTQLINKDIPNVINSLGLIDKVSYGYIKGKNNYICVDKLESYKNEYLPENPTTKEILSLILLERLIEQGEYGDIEEINYWILYHFEEILTHLRYVACDPNLCRPKKCIKECLYKNRIEELKEEDITVINHSLLAKWPYKEEKPLEHIIVDEAHNLVEKGYDFFSGVVNYRALNYFLQEIYPYENIRTSPFAYEKLSRRNRKIKTFDKFYNHVHFDRNIKDKISRNINLIVEEIVSILTFGLNSEYNGLSDYSLSWELNLQANDIVGTIIKNQQQFNIKYKMYSEKIKNSCDKIIRNLSTILVTIDRNIDEDYIDKEADIYKYGKSKIKEIEDIRTTLQIFLEFSEDDDYARVVEVDKEFNNFELRVIPLKLAELFEENILNPINSGVFLSATLSVENKMSYFKDTLGINRVANIEKIIPPLYDYKNRVCIIGINDICSYQNREFPNAMSDVIKNISYLTQGHMLGLFNSKYRQEMTYNLLKDYLHNENTEIYMNKKGIKHLKDINKKTVVLGSKGCFEGVDVPGDGLICVTLDKIPNLNPRDPLYSTIIKKYNIPYFKVNYPQMAIKVKQAMGRLLRSKYDYGCFIIFNIGSNYNTIKKLEQDLHQCEIKNINTDKLAKNVNQHLYNCRRYVMNDVLKDILLKININKEINMEKLAIYMNEEMKSRMIKATAVENNGVIKIKYFNQEYLIDKGKIIKNLQK